MILRAYHFKTGSLIASLMAMFVLIFSMVFAYPASANAAAPAMHASSEVVASIKEDGNVLFYSKNQVRNRLPISLESVRLSSTDRVEIIDVRDSEGRLLKFSQNAENGLNKITIEPRKPLLVGESIGLFTVSLHKNLVQQRDDTLVFEYDYTPDFPTTLQYTAIVPPSARIISVEPQPREQAGRRFLWEYQLEANEPFACRIKYSQDAPFGLLSITDKDLEELDKFAGTTYGGWRGNNIGLGWAWFHKSMRPHKNLLMPSDFRLAIKMNTLSAVNKRRRFGIMLDSTNNISFKRGGNKEIEDPWGKVAYCFFWSNCDTAKAFAYGVLRNGELVKSKNAPRIELKKEYEMALEKEGNQFRLFVNGKEVLEYTDPSLLETRHALKFGVHGPTDWKEIKALLDDPKYMKRFREVIDNLELTFVGYSKPDFTLIGADQELLEHRERIEPVDTINTWTSHVYSALEPIVMRINGFDEPNFSPGDSGSIEEVSDIDLGKLGFKMVSSEPLKEVTIGKIHFEVPPEAQPITRLVSYSREGSDEPVLFIEMGQAPSEKQAFDIFYSIRRQSNWGTYNGQDLSQAFYPHLASLAIRKGRWLIHVSLPLEEGEASELEGKWDTIRLFQRSIAGHILMHFYEMDINAR